MSLYGPKLRLPKMDVPNPANPSWNLDKEKKWIAVITLAIIIITLIVLLGPMLLNGAGESLTNALNPAIQVSWKNNPLDLKTNPIDPPELTLTFTNTTKETQNITFSIMHSSNDIMEYCPEYTLSNVASGDKREITCFIRRNGEIFTGTYTLEINSNLGNNTTKLEIIGK